MIKGKELTKEGLMEVLAGHMNGRGRFIIGEEHFLKISCELEAYVRLLSLIGSGRVKVRNKKGQGTIPITARRLLSDLKKLKGKKGC